MTEMHNSFISLGMTANGFACASVGIAKSNCECKVEMFLGTALHCTSRHTLRGGGMKINPVSLTEFVIIGKRHSIIYCKSLVSKHM